MACKDNGEVDDELFEREFVLLALENVLVEGVEGDDCADVLDVLVRKLKVRRTPPTLNRPCLAPDLEREGMEGENVESQEERRWRTRSTRTWRLIS